MNIALNMVVKNELTALIHNFSPIIQYFDEVVIIDTGSTDGTSEIFSSRYGIKIHHFTTSDVDPTNIVHARNHAISLTKSDWILTLDADERLELNSLKRLKDFSPAPDHFGYFGTWRDFRYTEPFDDWKLFLFRNFPGISFSGMVHAVPQHTIRALKLKAGWIDLVIEHLPEPKGDEHRKKYIDQMRRGIEICPQWYRYHWFLGYSYFMSGKLDLALEILNQVPEAKRTLFPAEVIFSHFLRSKIYFEDSDFTRAKDSLGIARKIYTENEKDFEIIGLNWLSDSLKKGFIDIKTGISPTIRRFSY
jgi:glycosyltransferase involved in cell wall biosynthesis